jgi:hypothetical protein
LLEQADRPRQAVRELELHGFLTAAGLGILAGLHAGKGKVDAECCEVCGAPTGRSDEGR